MTIPHSKLKITICPDEYHIKHVGRTVDGLQVFITSCLDYENSTKQTTDYYAAYKWDESGTFIGAKIITIGKRGDYNEINEIIRVNELIAEMKIIKTCEIIVNPCSVVKDNIVFGLIPRTDDGQTLVELMPGNCLCFTEPFDGAYDT